MEWNRVIDRVLPLPEFETEERLREAQMLRIILITVQAAVLLTVFLNLFGGSLARVVAPSLGYTAIVLAIWILLRRRLISAAAWIFLICGWGMITLEALTSRGVQSPDFGAYILIIIAAGLFFGTSVAVGATLLCFLCGLAMYLGEVESYLDYSSAVHSQANSLRAMISYGLSALVLVLMAVWNNRQSLERARREMPERKKTEAEILKEKHFSETLLSSLPGVFYLYDSEGRLRRWNQNLEKLTGFRAEEVRGRHALEWFSAAFRSKASQGIREVVETGSAALELPLLMKSGKEVPYLFTGVRLDDGGFMGVGVDVSELRESEEERSRLATAIEQAAEMVIISDAKGRIVFVNPAFEVVTGYRRLEVLGRDMDEVIRSDRHEPAFHDRIWGILRSGESWQGRIVNRKRDGSLFVKETVISPVRNQAGEIVNLVMVGRDVAQELEMEEQIRQSQKMEAIGQLAGGVAHDFNNLLQVILGYADLTAGELVENSPARSSLEEVQRAAERATALVQQLLAFSRRQALKLVPVDFNDLAGSLLKMIRRIIGEHIDLRFRPAGEAAWVEVDRGQMEQVLLNLCLNARDAMSEGGRLEIEVRALELAGDDPRLRQGVEAGRYVVLSVSDNGCGIPEKDRERIFEPFFTSKPVGEGTGLGLSTVYAIVARHRGFISLDSEAGKGSAFDIYLPEVQAPGDSQASENDGVQEEFLGGGETILLAEDEEQVRRLAVTLLEQAGYKVITASDGQKALELFAQHKDHIDLVMLDAVMPKKGGRVVYEEIHGQAPHLPIVFLSGYSYETIENGLLPLEGLRLIRKPFVRSVLLAEIRDALAQRSRDSQS